jgi:3',5'-nucleoside bisphosphate phosphatase
VAGRADLHSHTTASDGTLRPAEHVRWAAAQDGLAAIAVTDHDTIDGLTEAEAAAPEAGITLVPGVELSAEVPNAEVHVLGYYFDPHDGPLVDLLRRMREGRRLRAERAVSQLVRLGLTRVSVERVLKLGGETIGRPHLAAHLVELGYALSLRDAFDRYLARGRPGYVPRPKLTPEEAIRAILEAEGVPVLAHPGLIGNEAWVRRAVEAGVRGLEAYHTDHSPAQAAGYARQAREAGLIWTGGSDTHGPAGGRTVLPGSTAVPVEVVEQLQEASAYLRRA